MELLLRTLSSQPSVRIWQYLFILDFVFSSVPSVILSRAGTSLAGSRLRSGRPPAAAGPAPFGPTFRFSRMQHPVLTASGSAPSDLLARLSSLPCSLPSGLWETLLLLGLPHDIALSMLPVCSETKRVTVTLEVSSSARASMCYQRPSRE